MACYGDLPMRRALRIVILSTLQRPPWIEFHGFHVKFPRRVKCNGCSSSRSENSRFADFTSHAAEFDLPQQNSLYNA